METPNALKGFLYPSSRVSRCPRFHACLASKKCQNYDRHNLECFICEKRSNLAKERLGGHVCEGTYYPDLQDCIKTLQDVKRMALAHPDREGQTMNPREITNNFERYKEASEKMKFFSQLANITMEEKIVNAMADPETAKLLGKME